MAEQRDRCNILSFCNFHKAEMSRREVHPERFSSSSATRFFNAVTSEIVVLPLRTSFFTLSKSSARSRPNSILSSSRIALSMIDADASAGDCSSDVMGAGPTRTVP